MRDLIAAFGMLKEQIGLFPELRAEYEYRLWKSLRWACRHMSGPALRRDATSRAAIDEYLPEIKAMLADAANYANPYIGMESDLIKSYENSLSWKITAPLRFAAEMLRR